MYRNIFLISIGSLVLAIDQALKLFLTHSLNLNETIPVIKGIFHITLVFNTGCAFGLFKDTPNPLFLAISLAAVIFLIYFFRRTDQTTAVSKLAAALIMSGSASNLLDRLRFGYVIDFLDFRIWPVFNLGDTAITVGVAIFILKLLCHPEGVLSRRRRNSPKDIKDSSLRSE